MTVQAGLDALLPTVPTGISAVPTAPVLRVLPAPPILPPIPPVPADAVEAPHRAGGRHRRTSCRGAARTGSGLAPRSHASRGAPAWLVRHGRAVVVSDLAAVVVSTALYGVWGEVGLAGLATGGAAVLVAVVAAMMITKAWTLSILGQGTVEYSRLMNGMVGTGVAIGLGSLALDRPEGEPWVFGVLPVAFVLATAGRRVLRARLHRRRAAGTDMRSLLAVGSVGSVTELIRRTRQAPHEGFLITAACVPQDVLPLDAIDGVPVVGDVPDAVHILRSGSFDTVCVGRVPGWTHAQFRRLAWELETTEVDLVVDPGLMEVAGPRMHAASIDGLPLLHLTHPRFSGLSRLAKAGLDRIGAAILLIMLAPLMTVVALVIRLDGGPAFFLQQRVGLDGREFRIVKFRSMVIDAEAKLADLKLLNQGAGPLFKLHADPRVTPIGTILRRYSLDELPQLFNVLAGTMSLVGPRPPLPAEVAAYERESQRKLLVRPGMTGLWQVSGRSNLSWEESVRLDLRYVENWSFALDLQILVRTVRALMGSGAY